MKIYYMNYPGVEDPHAEGKYFPDLKSLKASAAMKVDYDRLLAPGQLAAKLSDLVETRASFKGVLVIPVFEVKVSPVTRQTLCDLAAGSRVVPGAATELSPVRIKVTVHKRDLPADFEPPAGGS